ncbi:MAG: LysR family transcriptional regulator [Ruminococcus albus]|nr:LysR family transcriptional regulator [Ruminococcus albus]MBR4555080.1 LysR family transcriptional regulator [Ruminococcus sp.]
MKNKFIRVKEVAEELQVSVPYAYKIIKMLNDELKAQGFMTISGRVSREYFYQRFFGRNEKEE